MRLLVSHIVVYQGCATFLTERPNAIKQIKLRATPSFHIGCPVLLVTGRDERIVDFCYLILSCFGKMISVSDPNPVLVETFEKCVNGVDANFWFNKFFVNSVAKNCKTYNKGVE